MFFKKCIGRRTAIAAAGRPTGYQYMYLANGMSD
eukprot:SAG31_NODE_34157_length_336_cov_0.510549_1_plen_33_part_01